MSNFSVCAFLSFMVGIIEIAAIFKHGGAIMPYSAIMILCTAMICDSIDKGK